MYIAKICIIMPRYVCVHLISYDMSRPLPLLSPPSVGALVQQCQAARYTFVTQPAQLELQKVPRIVSRGRDHC